MKTRFYVLIFLMGVISSISSCSDDEVTPVLDVHAQSGNLVMEPQANAQLDIHFVCNNAWQAQVDVNWVVLSSMKGEAGDITLSLLAKEDNRTGEDRTGTLILTSAGLTKEIKFTQKQTEVLNVIQTLYTIPATGGKIDIDFASNLQNCHFMLVAENGIPEWITQEPNSQTKTLRNEKISLTILPNHKLVERKANIQIYAVDMQNESNVFLKSPRISICQNANEVGISTDMTTKDKKVKVLQRHSKGNGVPIVIMGDGFLDCDIEIDTKDNYYYKMMEKAMENFFSEEPVQSLREYFDVWMVTAVSQNNAFGGAYSTRFSCKLEGGGSTGITGNHTLVKEYAALVPELQANPNLLNEVMVIVVLNTEEYAGTTYFGFANMGEFAIGYCPIINGPDDEMFRRVLCHECIGHGFTKLLDEYSYEQYGTIPATEIEKNRRMQQQLGWAMNVDFTNNREEVLWKHFLNDKRYQGKDFYGETLGVYEGACTYWRGAWRPTLESMMRSNTHGFNAPSREAIYKRVMHVAHGSEWKYDYEMFVAFDLAHLPQSTSTRNTNINPSMNKPFAAPRYMGHF
ncbi:M64 family metallopeptidase [Bacteroides muris (ex Afrizal et al. 2022)]|jgi:hypothetical protein|uniref:BACON domain-containing protein n=1 Tax=Bacteroides muris (ex Afrizal et al. 2022) TaxID=2516960 RepID=A0A4S2B225_9BACE|nr:M64 family metallopeptidase [Bacteroides muris (ex Afrizal et al. 2022)]TGY07743.1 hypothetical protein E5355_05575 [Bacteroides muris (ex Afrizal et al. 2022)]